MPKEIPVTLMRGGTKVFGDREGNEAKMVVVGFKDGKQLTFYGEEANTFLLHYFNGLQIKDVTEVPVPEPVEWGEVKKLQ